MASHRVATTGAPSYEVASKEDDPVRPQNRGKQGMMWSIYAAAVLALFVSAVIVAIVLDDSGFMWPLVLFGAVVIGVLLSGVVVPHLRDRSR